MADDRATLRQQLLKETKARIAASVDIDQTIIQAVTTLEQLEQAANRLAKKGREWYGLYNPEYERAANDHETFVKEAITKKAGEGSMGAPLAAVDEEMIGHYLATLTRLYEEKETLLAYLEKKLAERAPNLQLLAGTKIGAQLLSHAGSLQRLATVPSSTIQLYGAETALFRHLRDKRRHRSPKYGILFNHPLVQNVQQKDRGKAARGLADKLSLCVRLDLFGGELKADEYKKALEEKFTTW